MKRIILCISVIVAGTASGCLCPPTQPHAAYNFKAPRFPWMPAAEAGLDNKHWVYQDPVIPLPLGSSYPIPELP